MEKKLIKREGIYRGCIIQSRIVPSISSALDRTIAAEAPPLVPTVDSPDMSREDMDTDMAIEASAGLEFKDPDSARYI
jgi:hypothetical protein